MHMLMIRVCEMDMYVSVSVCLSVYLSLYLSLCLHLLNSVLQHTTLISEFLPFSPPGGAKTPLRGVHYGGKIAFTGRRAAVVESNSLRCT